MFCNSYEEYFNDVEKNIVYMCNYLYVYINGYNYWICIFEKNCLVGMDLDY